MGDMLVAGPGARQTMTGEAGNDRFVFESHQGSTQLRGTARQAVTVTDFKPGQDKLEFDNAGDLSFADVRIRSDDGHAEVRFAGFRIDLLGVDPKGLHAGDFLIFA